MKDRTLKSQFRIFILLILVTSLLATLLTYAVGVLLFTLLEYRSIYPANYYESKLPDIERYIQEQGAALLERDAQEKIEQIIPLEGIEYQVLDAKGEWLYGSVSRSFFQHPGELYQRLNTTFSSKGKYIRVVPILSEQGDHVGTALLAYELQVSPANSSGRFWIIVLFIAVIVAPFLYFILAILIFSKRFASRVNQPLQMLMEAAHQIKNKNLDFELDYRSNNELGQLCAAFSDMKDELKRSLFTQWRLEEERRTMTEALAHDLKTPMSLIMGYTEALLDDTQTELTEKQTRYLRTIKENAEKSSSLVRQMQYISDLESSVLGLEPIEVHIGSFIKQKISHYELQAKQKEIHIAIDLRGDADALVRVDTNKLEAILDNIITNSLEYTPIGGQIRITANVLADQVNYEICNTGPSFSGKDLEHMFRKFYRGEESRGGRGSHSGLGLYIVKQLTEKLGGEVNAYNSPSGGACISFTHQIARDRSRVIGS